MVIGKMCWALALSIIVMCTMLMASTGAVASRTYDFEEGLGCNWQVIGSSIVGITFSTTRGGDMYYADINSGWYNMTSDSGAVSHSGEYFISGCVALTVLELTDIGRITFGSPVSQCTIGYSSEHPFYLEAYSAAGELISSATGPINTKSHGDTGLQHLTVAGQGIAYVDMHDSGGYWLVDNITVVPEPSSAAVTLLGVVFALIGRFRRR